MGEKTRNKMINPSVLNTQPYLLVHFQLHNEKAEAIHKCCFKIKTDYCFLQQFYFKKYTSLSWNYSILKFWILFLQIHSQYLYFKIPLPQKCEYKTSYWNSYQYSSPCFVHEKRNIVTFWISGSIIAPISIQLCLSTKGPVTKGSHKAPIKCINKV